MENKSMDLAEFGIFVPLEEYFKYHPPKTKERIEAHEKINQHAYLLADILLDGLKFSSSQINTEIAVKAFRNIVDSLVTDKFIASQINQEVGNLTEYIDQKNGRLILFTIQIIRMLVNQAITIQDLEMQVKNPQNEG